MNINYDKILTEKRNENSKDLDLMSNEEIINLIIEEEYNVIDCLKKQRNNISLAIKITENTIFNRGRVIYIGAGTSGRLGLLDAVECPPTFGVNDNTFVGIIAGGENAFIKAKEGAEDDQFAAIEDLNKIDLCSNDTLVGIAASGRTPYVIAGVKYAKSIGCKTIGIACNLNSELSNYVDVSIEAYPGPEILTGSTRMKSGTVEKIILNMISTITMIRNGKVYQNLMVDVKLTNEKLRKRGERIIMNATGVDETLAKIKLEEANDSCKCAIVMILNNCNLEEAKLYLEAHNGKIRGI